MDEESSRDERPAGGSGWDEDPTHASDPADADREDGVAGERGVEDESRSRDERDDEGGHDAPDDEDASGGSVAGEFVPAGPVEPEDPGLENALFVVLGVFLTTLAFAGLVEPDVYTLRGMAALLGVGAVLTLIAFAFFGVSRRDAPNPET